MSTLRVAIGPHDHSTGPHDAPVTVVEYGDYQCPYCGQAFPVVKALVSRHPNVRFVFRNFPLTELHPEAMDAAQLAQFAADHGVFWQAHDLLFENQDRLGAPLYREICERLHVPFDEFVDAARRGLYVPRIESDERGGLESGVNGTPTFFVNGIRVDIGTAGLEAAVARELRRTARG